jgi:hypothetical protein
MKEIVMKTVDIRRHTMLVRVRDFGAMHRDLFPAAGTAGQLFTAISRAVDQLNAHFTTQAIGQGAVRESAKAKAAARDALRRVLETITQTARALAVDTPGLGGKFRLPSARNDHELVTAARTFAQDAKPLKARFRAYGLPRTFLADLQAALDGFNRATQDCFVARETRAGARASIGTAIGAVLVILSRLDAVVLNTLRDEPGLLAVWTSARQVAKVRARADREPAPADPPPATPAVPAPSDTPDTGKAA